MKRKSWALWAVTMAAATLMAADSPTQKLVIKGSNTFGEELAPALIEGFKQKNPAVDVDLESKGSGSGIAALLEGMTDIASSSRSMNEDELRLAKSRQMKISQHVIGYYGIAVIVSESNPVRALSDRQVSDLFAGVIANWKEVGGPDAPVNLYTADPRDGTYLGFQELAMGNRPYASTATAKPSYTDIQAAVAADPHGIGYVSLQMATHAGTHGLIINGIHPSNIAVVENLYPYARQVRLFTNRDTVSRMAKRFVRFVQSREGQEIVEQVGFVPRLAAPIDFGGMGP